MCRGAMTTSTVAAAFPEVLARALHEGGLTLSEFARRAGISPVELQELVDGSRIPSRGTIEIVARALDSHPAIFIEFRVDCIADWLSRRPSSADDLFIESLSPLERQSVDPRDFDPRPLKEVLASLRAVQGLTQGELAEDLGVEPAVLSRELGSHGHPSAELLEAIAAALGVPPETLLAYRLAIVRDWLLDQPARVDELYSNGLAPLALEPHRCWPSRRLPDPIQAEPKDLLRILVEIVAAEGPVIGARVYAVWLDAAGGLDETMERRKKLNRISAAAVHAGLVAAENEHGEPTQRYLTLRLPATPAVVVRARGDRRLTQIPPSELAEVVRQTSAWRRNASTASIQRELAELYGLRHLGSGELEYLNKSINLAGGGTR